MRNRLFRLVSGVVLVLEIARPTVAQDNGARHRSRCQLQRFAPMTVADRRQDLQHSGGEICDRRRRTYAGIDV